MNPRGRRKKVSKAPELVSKCDHCGKPFGRTKAGMTYARTQNSAGLLAPSNGLAYRKRKDGVFLVFCDRECALQNWDESGENVV
jgi:hypothetical protein